MPKSFKRTTVTAALPYANGPKHIGHLAGAYLPADIYVRWLRNKGQEVAFICGSDEHGAAITIQAIKEKTTPREIIDTYHVMVKDCFQKLGISFDIYHRTSERIHHETAQAFFLDLFNKGILTEETSEQYFDTEANVFLADRYIIGTCPRCGNENAYGDQCEKCGSALSPRELKNPRSTLTGNAPTLRETKHWMLPLEKYEGFLREWILEGHKSDWKVNVYGQCKSWIESGLQPRAVTRDLDWGVKVPLKDADGKVLYVWFDAPIGYISATRQWAIDKGEDWEKWWKDPETRLIHFIGKDNIVFHCIIFPVMLHAHGEYILPENVPANEFLNLEGDKMSTSRRWSVEMHEYLEAFPNKQDELRYVLTAIAPETKDSDFSWKYTVGNPTSTDSFQAKVNNELSAILGNFVNRVMVLTHKFYEGKVPQHATLTDAEHALLNELKQREKAIGEAIEQFRFREALAEVMNIARAGNKYFTDSEPWKVVKTDTERTKTIMWAAVQLTASLAYIMEPFLPFTSAKIFHQLNLQKEGYTFGFDLVPAGHSLNPSEILFAQVTDEEMDAQVHKLKASAAAIAEAEVKPIAKAGPDISFDDFKKLDVRVGTILEGEAVPKSDKLLKFIVDVGFEKRQIVSGVAEHYKPEELIGKQCLVLVNLPAKKIRGVESNGMLLFAENLDGKLKLVAPAFPAENGAKVS